MDFTVPIVRVCCELIGKTREMKVIKNQVQSIHHVHEQQSKRNVLFCVHAGAPFPGGGVGLMQRPRDTASLVLI